MDEQKYIRSDRMRYEKNKLSANLALLSIIFNVLYFVSIYKTNSDYYYKLLIGVSVLYNLIFMLACFLSSEGVKNYKFSFAVVLIVIGAMQIGRIFILPLGAYKAVITSVTGDITVMDNGQFIYTIIMLLCSAVSAIIGGVFGIIRSRRLASHNAFLKDVEAGVKELPDFTAQEANDSAQENA